VAGERRIDIDEHPAGGERGTHPAQHLGSAPVNPFRGSSEPAVADTRHRARMVDMGFRVHPVIIAGGRDVQIHARPAGDKQDRSIAQRFTGNSARFAENGTASQSPSRWPAGTVTTPHPTEPSTLVRAGQVMPSWLTLSVTAADQMSNSR
jgi:hypothetical protein